MKRNTTLAERIEIMEEAQGGKRDQEIAQKLGYSYWTVRKWRRKSVKEGRIALVSHLGRPKQGALAEFSEALRKRLLDLRQKHPGWGTKTLRCELEREAWSPLPSHSSIGRFLRENGLLKAYEKHQALPASEFIPCGEVHETWEMDAKGHDWVEGVGYVA